MRFVSKGTWEEIFRTWKQQEGSDPAWMRLALEKKGWPDWESWRKFTASQFDAPKLDWEIFEFTDPMNEIPAMLIGPFEGWQRSFAKKNTNTFANLLDVPEACSSFAKNGKVREITKDFPFPTQMIGLLPEDTSKIICIEGHHRAAAVALAKKEGTKINFKGPVRIALAKLPSAKVFLLDKMLKRGSTKNPDA